MAKFFPLRFVPNFVLLLGEKIGQQNYSIKKKNLCPDAKMSLPALALSESTLGEGNIRKNIWSNS